MSPTTQLLLRHLEAHHLTLDTLAPRLAPKNVSHTVEKLRAVFHQDGGTQAMIRTLRLHLDIPSKEWEEALLQEHRLLQESNEAWQRSHFVPHLWIELNDSLIQASELPRRDQRVIPLPGAMIHLQVEAAHSTELASWIHSLYQSARKLTVKETERLAQACVFGDSTPHCPTFPQAWISHFLYRCTFDLAYRFTPDGSLIEKLESAYLIPHFPHRPTRF